MRSLYLVVGLTLLFKFSGNAQTITSAGSGPWNQGSTWVGGVVPTSANSTTVTITSTHAVTIPSGYNATAVNINLAGNTLVSPQAGLTIDAGGSLTHTGVLTLGTLTTRGRVIANGIFNLTQGATIAGDVATVGRLAIGATGTYRLNYTTTAGIVYTASWATGSTLEIAGYTTNVTPPTGLGQAFSNFTWNCVNQQNDFYLPGTLTNVAGNFSVLAPTGTWVFGLTDAASNLTLAIGGNLTLGPDVFIDLNGGSGNTTVNLLGNFNMSTDEAIGNYGGGTAVINFRNTSVAQSYNSANTISSPVDFAVFTGTTLNIPAANNIQNAGSFSLASGATLGVASVDGLVIGQSAGALRTGGSRFYTDGGNIIYNGSSAQNLGDEWGPTGSLNGIKVNLEINNTSTGGVTNNIIGSTNLVGRLRLTKGPLNIGNSNTLIISGDFEGFSSPARVGTISGDASNTSNLEFGGSGTVTGTLNFTTGASTLRNLSMNRADDVTLGSNLTIATTGTLSFPESGNLHIDGQTLTVNGNITQVGSGGLASNVATTNISIGGSGALSALPFCTVCGTNTFNNVTLNRTGGASYTWNSAATINGILNLNAGAFTHSSGLTMATGSTVRRNAGTTYTGSTPNATTRYNVAYVGNLTTSAELPTTALNRLADLTVAGTVTLDKSIIINGNLSITSGILQANTRNVTMRGTSFAINGGQFTINSTNSVTFDSGTTTSISGTTVNDAQFGNFVINSGTIVSAPNANINVSNQWTNNGTFTPNTGTVTFNGTTQSINPNGQAFYNFETSGGTKTLTGALDVDGELDINTGSTLVAGANTINIAGLWSNDGTFTPGTGTVIFDGTTQLINNSGQAFNAVTFANSGTKTLGAIVEVAGNLIINSGVTLDASVNNYNLLSGGNFTNNGTFTARNGTVVFNGPLTQLVGGSTNTQFYNISQSNATTVTYSTPQSLVNALTLTAGTFNPNGNFTLLSTATGDARIDELQGTSTIANSSIIAQRYLPNTAGVSVARYMSSPVSNAMLSGWKDNFPITAPAAVSDHSTNAEWAGKGINPYPFTETGNSIQVYNEGLAAVSLDNRYVGYPLTGTLATTPIVPGVGYNVRPRVTAAITADLVGRPNFGNVSVTVTAQGLTSNDGWNLVGNPYPSPINWNNVTKPGGLSNQIALKDNTNNIGLGAGQYVYYTAGGAAIPASYTGTIAQGQAFWVRKLTVGSTTLTFKEADKQAVSNPKFMRENEENILRVHVAAATSADELVISFSDQAQDIAEGNLDAFKLTNQFINFSSLSSDNVELAINTFGSLACSREIPLVLKNATAGGHMMSFSQMESFPSGVDIRLADAFTGQTFLVSETNKDYSFQVTTDANSFGASRFKIYIGYKDLDLSSNLQSADGCNGSDAQIKILAPQKGVSYYATINGNTASEKYVAIGSELIITIPAANLTADENTVVLKAQNGTCAEMPLTQSAKIKKNGMPEVNVSEATGCGESSLTLNATGAPSGGSYRWYLTEDATDAIAGETNSSFTTPSLIKTKTYFVSAVSALGCESSRKPVTATISYVDAAAITVQNDLLVSSSETGNQWYLNGEMISGATSKTYKPKESGVYRLVITTGTCSSQVEREYAITGDIDGDGLKGYVLYPNPSSGLVYVEVATTSEVAVSIVNGVGKEITRGNLKQEGNRRKGQFDITGQASGVYLVVIKHDQNTVTRKIVKN